MKYVYTAFRDTVTGIILTGQFIDFILHTLIPLLHKTKKKELKKGNEYPKIAFLKARRKKSGDI